MSYLDLFPIPRFSALYGGDPIPLAKLYFYAAGSDTVLQDTYVDALAGSANANPVVADANGLFGPIYMQALPYKVKLKSSDGTIEYWSQDKVAGQTFAAFLSTVFRVSDGTDPTKKLAFDVSNITTATTRTRIIQNADGVESLGDTASVHLQTAAECIDQSFWIAPYACIITAVKFVASVAETTASPAKVMVTNDTSTNAPGGGADVLTNNTNTGFDLRATANTVQSGTLSANTTMAAGDRLSLDFAATGTITETAGLTVIVTVRRTA